jgi:hypothetical protein
MPNVEYGESFVDYTVALTTQDTEYSLALPDGVKAVEIQAREGVDVRMACVAGKVAGSTDPYRTIKSGTVYLKELLWVNATTLYFAAGSGSRHVEVRAWF